MKMIKPQIFFVAAATLTLLLNGCKDHKETHPQAVTLPVVKVETAKVQEQTAPLQIEILGTIQAVHSAVIATKVSGNVTELPVELGSKVAKGQLLLKIEAGELLARLEQSKAQLEQAKRNLTREENLLKKNAATPEAVKALRDMVKIAEAAYQEAQTMIEYTTIEAPFDGLVTQKLVNRGDLVTPGRPLLQLDNEFDLQVITNLPESILPSIKLGQQYELSVPAINRTVTGTVSEIAPSADPVSRTGVMKMRLPATEDLVPGQFAKIYLIQKQLTTMMIPETAVFPLGQLERVFVIDHDKVRLKLVRTGIRHKGMIEILSGLSLGEEVVAEAASPLLDNQPVTFQ